jgi:hypothetical protein
VKEKEKKKEKGEMINGQRGQTEVGKGEERIRYKWTTDKSDKRERETNKELSDK